jgi:ankyrin repeat protein
MRVARLLDAGAAINGRDRRTGATPLLNAAAVGSVETMTLLLGRGADVNARSAAGATALMWAANDAAKVRLLIDRGADVNVVTESGRTALLLAALSDQSADIVRLLLSRGANPRAIDAGGMTTLLGASVGNDTESIRQLLDAGVNPNTGDGVGFTPLIWAAWKGNHDAVRLLLARGADVNAQSGPPFGKVKNGITALGHFTPLIEAAPYAPFELVQTLVDAGANVNAKEARGLTPLMLVAATDHGDPRIAQLLIDRGADVHLTSLEGETALDWALKSGPSPILQLLERAGARPASRASHPAIPPASPVPARQAIERSVRLLEPATTTFGANGGCRACHAQPAAAAAIVAARRAGIRVDQGQMAQWTSEAIAAHNSTATRLLERFDGPAVDIPLYSAWGLAASEHPADRATDALVFTIAAQQWSDGSWRSSAVRPPMADGDVAPVALGIRALKTYGMPGRQAEMNARVEKAARWLRDAPQVTADDRAFRLLGLAWGGADRSTLDAAARGILAVQKADGGWGQRDTMASDAYATGLTLYALLESRTLASDSAAAHRAAEFLRSTQRADGSWYVRSRAPKFQPYFDGGFPYGHDQWISSMATGWATLALTAGLSPAPAAAAQ